MPVRVDGSAQVTSADQAIPTEVQAGNNSVVPLLIWGSPHEIFGGLALHELGENERLVASDVNASLAGALFAGAKIISVDLNSTDLLPGPAAAWEALDAVVLESAAMQRIGDAQRSTLLSAGVVLAVHGDRPDGRWPWKLQDGVWILRHSPVGPGGQLVDATVYAPTYTWAPGWDADVRRAIVVAAVLMGISVLAIAMWRSKIAILFVVLLCVFCTASAMVARRSMGIVSRAGGEVAVVSNQMVQRDSWLYEQGREDGIRQIKWDGLAHPVLASVDGASQWRLIVNANGDLVFEYHAKRGETIAVLRRDVEPIGAPLKFDQSTDSPLRDLVKADYSQAGIQIVGEQTGAPGRWNTVALKSISDR